MTDILAGIALIESFVADMDFAAYERDPKTQSAVERQLQIITEAAKRLGEDAEVLCHGPDWRGFCRMGDLLRHWYHKVDALIVWNTVKDELPPMREVLHRTLSQL